MMRSGLVGKKLGMTRIFTEKGEHIPVTVVQVDDCQIIGHKTVEVDGYSAVPAFNESLDFMALT